MPTRLYQAQTRFSVTMDDEESVTEALHIASVGPLGISVMLTTAVAEAWVTAFLGIQVSMSENVPPVDPASDSWIDVYDAEGSLILVTVNEDVPGLYTFPDGIRSVGNYPWMRLVSVDAEGVAVPQTGGPLAFVVGLLG